MSNVVVEERFSRLARIFEIVDGLYGERVGDVLGFFLPHSKEILGCEKHLMERGQNKSPTKTRQLVFSVGRMIGGIC